MHTVLIKMKRFFAQIRGFFPTELPKGRDDFDRFMKSLFDTYQIPDNDSHLHAISSLIMHCGPTQTKVTKRYLAKSIFAAQAREIAFTVLKEIRDKDTAKVVARGPTIEQTAATNA